MVTIIPSHFIMHKLHIGNVEHYSKVQSKVFGRLLQLSLERFVHIDPSKSWLPVTTDVPQAKKLWLSQAKPLGNIGQTFLTKAVNVQSTLYRSLIQQLDADDILVLRYDIVLTTLLQMKLERHTCTNNEPEDNRTQFYLLLSLFCTFTVNKQSTEFENLDVQRRE